MEEYLIGLARDYVKAIEKVADPSLEPEDRRWWEGQRGLLHQQFVEALERAGYPYTSREHTTEIAYRFLWLARLEGYTDE